MREWSALFDWVEPAPPASESELANLRADLVRPVSEEEAAELIRLQACPWPASHPYHAGWVAIDPLAWPMPSYDLPASYLSFLRWSNGPATRRGEREFGFLPAQRVREYLLAYHLPQYMPLAVPLGLDGGGIFALLDGRQRRPDGEWPVLAARSGALDFDEARPLAETFEQFCVGTTPIEDAW